MKKFQVPNSNFLNVIERRKMVMWISRVILAPNLNFEPHPIVPNNNFSWVLDPGEEWKVYFSEKEKEEFQLQYLGKDGIENTLAKWLNYKIKLENGNSIV